MTKINVDIITEYKGSQKIKTAEKDLGGLQKTLNHLGKAFAATFAVDKILEFGKASVEAFSADQKSAVILSQTLQNLGQSFANVPVEEFITKLSEVNGIAKTDLRNAFDTLVRSTGHASKAQDLLNLGLDISAGTGKDLALVSTALAKGYAGNFSALSKLGAGLTAAEIKSGDFLAIQKHLAATFKGDAAAAADTMSGKVNRIKTAFEEVKITIGSGLSDAFASLDKSGNLTTIQDGLKMWAEYVANLIRGFAVIIGYVETIAKKLNGLSKGWLGKLIKFTMKYSVEGQIVELGKKSTNKKAEDKNAAAAAAKLAADRAAAQKAELAAANKIKQAAADKLSLERASLSLKLAGQTTDMQNIEIQAALQRGQTKEVVDVLLLQRAIITGNADEANILSQEILRANGLVMDVKGNISSLAGAKNPFADWPAASSAAKSEVDMLQAAFDALNLNALAARIKAINDSIKALNQNVDVNVTTSTNGNSSGQKLPSWADPTGNLASSVTSTGTSYNVAIPKFADPSGNLAQGTTPVSVTVVMDNQVVANSVTSTQVNQSASGIPNSFARNYAGAW
jgi:hypothetical protein